MNSLIPKTAAEAVANGAQLLDEKHPGWWRHIDLGTLNVDSGVRCICGQLDKALNGHHHAPDWYGFARAMDKTIECFWKYGFSAGIAGVETINAEWCLVINARREADKLADEIREAQQTLREKKELMLA